MQVEVFDRDNARLGLPGFRNLCHTGTSVLVEGQLKATPEGVKQPVELHASRIVHVGQVSAPSAGAMASRLCTSIRLGDA